MKKYSIFLMNIIPYFFMSFYKLSLNPALWTSENRGTVLVMLSVTLIISGMFYQINKLDN